jgi:hypothetical protein
MILMKDAAMSGPHDLVTTYREGPNRRGLHGLNESVQRLAAIRLCDTLSEKMLKQQQRRMRRTMQLNEPHRGGHVA